MTNIELWKNFNLGTELDISGNCIFNGIKIFHQMKIFYYEDEIFDFLYNISVGIERLFKIIISLNKEIKFEIKTHNHEQLFQEIKRYYHIKTDKQHNKFIQILNIFYDKARYDRFDFKIDKKYNQEYKEFISFLTKYTKYIISNDIKIEITKNNDDIKIFIGNLISTISNKYYVIIQEEARKQNILTDEIRSNSKPYKIFIKKEYNFLNDKIITIELLLFIIQNKSNTELLILLNNIKSLNLDDLLMEQYINTLISNNSIIDDAIYDEIDFLQSEHNNKQERLNDIQSLSQIMEQK